MNLRHCAALLVIPSLLACGGDCYDEVLIPAHAFDGRVRLVRDGLDVVDTDDTAVRIAQDTPSSYLMDLRLGNSKTTVGRVTWATDPGGATTFTITSCSLSDRLVTAGTHVPLLGEVGESVVCVNGSGAESATFVQTAAGKITVTGERAFTLEASTDKVTIQVKYYEGYTTTGQCA